MQKKHLSFFILKCECMVTLVQFCAGTYTHTNTPVINKERMCMHSDINTFLYRYHLNCVGMHTGITFNLSIIICIHCMYTCSGYLMKQNISIVKS